MNKFTIFKITLAFIILSSLAIFNLYEVLKLFNIVLFTLNDNKYSIGGASIIFTSFIFLAILIFLFSYGLYLRIKTKKPVRTTLFNWKLILKLCLFFAIIGSSSQTFAIYKLKHNGYTKCKSDNLSRYTSYLYVKDISQCKQ